MISQEKSIAIKVIRVSEVTQKPHYQYKMPRSLRKRKKNKKYPFN